ncbi:hypothetical protein GH714_042403 [Hevea brasiliensis]|uniref:Uncharacterized protein n=1 Tax=Hevea brasiliensis TaxID=3981 RepID=A0A6A6NFA2_HEVBR|nr:hypothetical protein GH714_042403 [Hevea brasiliensis]
MASSQSDQDHQPRKESGQASSDGNDPSPAGHPQATGYSPTMGYPTNGLSPGQYSGYPPPGQPAGYPGYNNGYNNNYPYAQAPPASYYHPQASIHNHKSRSRSGSSPGYFSWNNESTIKFQLDVMSEYGGEDVAKEISNKRNHGSVAFVVKIFAWIRFSSGFWRMREHMLRVHCNPVRIGFREFMGPGIPWANRRNARRILVVFLE